MVYMNNLNISYTHVYKMSYLGPGVVPVHDFLELKQTLNTWSSRGDNAFRYMAKAHNDIKNFDSKISQLRAELLAYKMFYLSTKLAAQVSNDDINGFNRAVERILEAEEKINNLSA